MKEDLEYTLEDEGGEEEAEEEDESEMEEEENDTKAGSVSLLPPFQLGNLIRLGFSRPPPLFLECWIRADDPFSHVRHLPYLFNRSGPICPSCSHTVIPFELQS